MSLFPLKFFYILLTYYRKHTLLCGFQSFSLGTLTAYSVPLSSPSSSPGFAPSLCCCPLLLQVCNLLWLHLIQLYSTFENQLKHYHFWEAFLAKSQPLTNFCKPKTRVLWKSVLFWTRAGLQSPFKDSGTAGIFVILCVLAWCGLSPKVSKACKSPSVLVEVS